MKIIKTLLAIAIIAATAFGLYSYTHQPTKATLGAADTNLFLGGFPYFLAGSGVSSTATSFTLTSFTLPQNSYPIQDSDMASTFYLTFEPGNRDRQEFASCTTVGTNTGGNVTISGCTRGLAPISPYTASTTLEFSHAGGSTVIFSNSPSFYKQFYALGNVATSTNTLIFSSTTPPKYDGNVTVSGNELVSFNQLNATAIAGGATSTEGVLGYVALDQASNLADGTASTTSGAPLVIQNKFATTTPGTLCTGGTWNCIVASASGKISQSWLDLTQHFAFSSLFATAASSTNATTTNQSITGVLSSILKTNSEGDVTAATAGTDYDIHYNYATTTAISANNGYATSTSLVIPAGTLTASSTISVLANVYTDQGSTGNAQFYLRDVNGTNTFLTCQIKNTVAGGGYTYNINGLIYNNSSLSSQVGYGTETAAGTNSDVATCTGTGTYNTTNALSLVGVVYYSSATTVHLASMAITVSP